MPGELEAEEAARQVREELERELFNARERLQRAEIRWKEASAAAEADQRRKLGEQDTSLTDFTTEWLGGVHPVGEPSPVIEQLEDLSGEGGQPELPPADPELAANAEAADREEWEARSEVERIEREIAALPPPDDIMLEAGDANPGWGGSEAAAKYQAPTPGLLPFEGAGPDAGSGAEADESGGPPPTRDRDLLDAFGRGGCREVLGVLGIVVGGALLGLSLGFGGDDLVTPGGPGLTEAPAQSQAAAQTDAGVPSATDGPVVPGQTDDPETGPSGNALALVDFFDGTDPCPVEAFQSGFRLQADNGDLTATQLVPGGDPHVTTGMVDRSGAWETMGDMQTYRGMFIGSRMEGMYSQPDGCDYAFRGFMDRPWLWPDPWGTAAARFEFYDPVADLFGFALEHIAEGNPAHIIVGSNGNPDIRTLMPILIVLLVDDVEVWSFLIEGDPAVVCRDATGCSADAPTPRMAEWDDEGVELLLIATAADGTVIAVHSTRSEPPPAPGAGPSAPPAASAPATAAGGPSQPAASAPSSGAPTGTGGGRGVNLPLAGAGVIIIIVGAGYGFGPRIKRARDRPRAPV